ncbi:TPA: hypothetical protein ACGUS9_002511 [Vibrio vulnificus]
MQNVEDSLGDFSKHLLVTVFAIFAFTSGALLGATSVFVKLAFMLSLILAILGMNCGFKVIMTKVNYFLSDESKGKDCLPKNKIITMRRHLQWQYYFSIVSLGVLVISVALYFLTENYYLVSFKW